MGVSVVKTVLLLNRKRKKLVIKGYESEGGSEGKRKGKMVPIVTMETDYIVLSLQLSRALVITGLRNTCPNDIVLYEADLQPLSLKRSASLVKYYSKLCSLRDTNSTSAYLRDWRNVQRLKRNSPFSMVASAHLLESNVEQHILVQCVDPSDSLPNVHFHTDLSVQRGKSRMLSERVKRFGERMLTAAPNPCQLAEFISVRPPVAALAGEGTRVPPVAPGPPFFS
ncbi:reverse transcriptase domain-containing protein [Caerostris darwini]|uniref:Reverse transcriptase domain-containing protein n=1 Tax=Caerostris darwini TaxID=1538125 RepID=A0AAV4P9J7_9ARAC|nr:reverse transcriptase domain-containing protein [Caerostris darwini]